MVIKYRFIHSEDILLMAIAFSKLACETSFFTWLNHFASLIATGKIKSRNRKSEKSWSLPTK
jgi:hypothetical protein